MIGPMPEQPGTATYYPTSPPLVPHRPRRRSGLRPPRHAARYPPGIFFTEDDRRFYLRTLGEQPRLHGVDIMVCCRRTNHAHLVLVPRDATGLELAAGCTHWRCIQAINRLHDPSDHPLQSGLFPCPLDDEHALRRSVARPERPQIDVPMDLARFCGATSGRHLGFSVATTVKHGVVEPHPHSRGDVHLARPAGFPESG